MSDDVKMKPEQILMGPANPHGWKLEDLLDKIIREVAAKSEKIADDRSPQAVAVTRNNLEICDLLIKAVTCQKDSMDLLDRMGPNQGPTGQPRIGPGSEGQREQSA